MKTTVVLNVSLVTAFLRISLKSDTRTYNSGQCTKKVVKRKRTNEFLLIDFRDKSM